MGSDGKTILKPEDFTQARQFLAALDPKATAFVFQTFDDNASRKDLALARVIHGSLEECAPQLRALNQKGAGVFVTVNRSANGGRKKGDIVACRAIWREADEPNLPALPITPHLTVETSPGKKHEYLLIDDAGPARGEDIMGGMVTRYGSDPNAKDRSRVLRLPGFYHCKGEPHMVRIINQHDAPRYSIDYIAEHIPPAETSHPKPAETQMHNSSDKYCATALANELAAVCCAAEGSRNGQLNKSAHALGQLIAGGGLDRGVVERALTSAAVGTGLPPNEVAKTINSGLTAGMNNPRKAPGRPLAGTPDNKPPDNTQAPPVTMATVPSKLSLQISDDEWDTAKLAPACIVRDFLYADVAVLAAPGGTGKTTISLYESIHIVLERSLYGLDVEKPGWCLFITAEDNRETLIARLREIACNMGLTGHEMAAVRRGVLFWDVSGENLQLIQLDDGNTRISELTDDIVSEYKDDPPVLVTFDPIVSFGVGESKVNENEQGLIVAARRIRNGLGCAVRVVHHTGKANARGGTLDQYTARGGSALPDGSRMTFILQPWTPKDVKHKPPDGCTPSPEASLTILARPKLSYSRPNLPLIWIKRTGWQFEHFTETFISEEETKRSLLAQVHRFIASGIERGARYNKTALHSAHKDMGLTRQQVRDAIELLMAEGQIVEAELPKDEQSTKRKTFLSIRRDSAGFVFNPLASGVNNAKKNPSNNSAAYRESVGGIIIPPNTVPVPNPARDTRRDSARLAGLDKTDAEPGNTNLAGTSDETPKPDAWKVEI